MGARGSWYLEGDCTVVRLTLEESVGGGGGARPEPVRLGGGAKLAGSRRSLSGRATCVLLLLDVSRPRAPFCSEAKENVG